MAGGTEGASAAVHKLPAKFRPSTHAVFGSLESVLSRRVGRKTEAREGLESHEQSEPDQNFDPRLQAPHPGAFQKHAVAEPPCHQCVCPDAAGPGVTESRQGDSETRSSVKIHLDSVWNNAEMMTAISLDAFPLKML